MNAKPMRHLRCLVAVAEELHFGRAAERLHLTQPPVSLAIKELEEELGVTLFERTSRRIALTRAGEDALRDARAVLAAAESMRKRAQEAAQGLMGSLSIGFISLPAYSFLPTTLRAFTEDYQRVKLTLEEGTTEQIIHAPNSPGTPWCLWQTGSRSDRRAYWPDLSGHPRRHGSRWAT